MAFFDYLCQDYLYTSENEAYSRIKKLLEEQYSCSVDKHCLLLGNFSCQGNDLDAVIIKNDAILVVEFKNYGGDITFSESGNWSNEETIIKGGSGNRNPLQQVKNNKFALLNTLQDYVGFENSDLGHISGIVLFQNPIQINQDLIPGKLRTWFHVVDMDNFSEKVQNITSPKIRIKPEEFKRLLHNLNIDPFFVLPRDLESNIELGTPTKIELDAIAPVTPFEEQIHEKPTNEDEEIDSDGMSGIFESLGFNLAYLTNLSKRAGAYQGIDDLGLHQNVEKVISKYNGQIYRHQHTGLKFYSEGKNVCMATSTSSGKSEVFYWSAIDLFSRDKEAKIIAIYPMKALGRQQEERWTKALHEADPKFGVARIDGSVTDKSKRVEVIRDNNNRVIIMTPDVIHSWLLKNLDDPRIKTFLSKVKLVVLDEVHNYKGVFGSNSAFLLRRLNHAVYTLCKNVPQYISASATIKTPEDFLKKLTGLDFELVDQSLDTSPKHDIGIYLIDGGDSKELLSKVANLINHFINETDHQSITFVDSRKMVEQLTVIARRLAAGKRGLAANYERTDECEDAEELEAIIKELGHYGIFPYRAGYEEDDTRNIQKKLQRGELRSVISTSALEVGIDIAGLDVGIIMGVPGSATSLSQRIGRIGRHKDGKVIIINDGSFRSQILFQNAQQILNLPWEEGVLYLDNENIQYIHALCFASQNSEYDKLAAHDADFETSIEFPENFINICNAERIGQVPKHLQHFKTMIDDSPNITYPLRDVEPQFSIGNKIQGNINRKGNLSMSQMMREAYPHAIYYYAGEAYRVKKILKRNKEIQITRSKFYTTQPIKLPTSIMPNLRSDNIYSTKKYTDLLITECNLQINENIVGVTERRGSAEPITIQYPFRDGSSEYNEGVFSRRYFTSGVVIFSSHLPRNSRVMGIVSKILFEVFLVVVPFETQDISFGFGKLKVDFLEMGKDTQFISIYDQTYGSLRLTQYLMDHEILLKVFKRALEAVENKENNIIPEEFLDQSSQITEILEAMLKSVNNGFEVLNLGEEIKVTPQSVGDLEIIRPFKGFISPTKDWQKSRGMDPLKNNEYFYIEKIDRFNHEGKNDFCYHGYYESETKFDENGSVIMGVNQAITIIGLNKLIPCFDSARALFNSETQEVNEI